MLESLRSKREKYVVGLMSGTSVDGIDAALVKITGSFTATQVEEMAFKSYPFPPDIRQRIFALFDQGSTQEVCHMNFILGELFAKAALDIAKEAGVAQIDLIGSHGQTIYHMPNSTPKATLQIGEGAVIAHATGATVVSDFRTADMAAGGIGAPLVPYTEFLLYTSQTQHVALQNIGGIGNVTIIPKGCTNPAQIMAFDTGPGNMVIDYITQQTKGQPYDKDGYFASLGQVSSQVLTQLMADAYITTPPPKATGREHYGAQFSQGFYAMCKAQGLSHEDMIATATAFTAHSIAHGINHFASPMPQQLIIGGGGAYNPTLVSQIATQLPQVQVVTGEALGIHSDAKEAIAFAILANETIAGNPGNLPSVTGATAHKILGKISM